MRHFFYMVNQVFLRVYQIFRFDGRHSYRLLLMWWHLFLLCWLPNKSSASRIMTAELVHMTQYLLLNIDLANEAAIRIHGITWQRLSLGVAVELAVPFS
jgi:hypothetical protein